MSSPSPQACKKTELAGKTGKTQRTNCQANVGSKHILQLSQVMADFAFWCLATSERQLNICEWAQVVVLSGRVKKGIGGTLFLVRNKNSARPWTAPMKSAEFSLNFLKSFSQFCLLTREPLKSAQVLPNSVETEFQSLGVAIKYICVSLLFSH